jgi:hypothetical protein
MICYDSHALMLALMSFLSRSSIEEDATCFFSPGKRESEVYH